MYITKIIVDVSVKTINGINVNVCVDMHVNANFDVNSPKFERGIFFAGEATSRHRFGYMDGAAVTGVREATRIWNMFGPSIHSKL